MVRPNILLLLIDCLRADALYGARRWAHTPTLDRLVRSGIACTQAVASASSTTPCVASLLTGTYSFVHGIRSIFGLKLTPSVPSLVEVLRDRGYHTYAEVSGPLFPETGLDRGFDWYQCREGSAYLSTAWGADFRRRLRVGAFTPPWFLFLHLWELHHRRHILPAFRSRTYGRNRYERALSSLDAELESLLAALPANTLIIIHGDHGERIVETDFRYRIYRLSRDLLGRRNTMKREGHEMDIYEDLIRVPLVFTLLSGDGPFPAGRQVPQLVRQIDVLPTLLDLLDLPVPPDIHGRSLKPALLKDTPLHLEAYLEAFLRIRSDPRDRRVGWRTEEWKYIYAPQNPEIPEELYFLPDDPQERRNLAARRPDVVAKYRGRIESLQQGPLAQNPGIVMSEEEQASIAKRLTDLGYM
ncbi:MAG: sulfatase-like hydrolase/transferase [Thermodesulfobacteriota bacterium]